jgi:hypothetical protein
MDESTKESVVGVLNQSANPSDFVRLAKMRYYKEVIREICEPEFLEWLKTKYTKPDLDEKHEAVCEWLNKKY